MNAPLLKIGLAIIVGFALVPWTSTAQGRKAIEPLGPYLNMPEAQRAAIMKADRQKNINDVAALLKLAQQLKSNFDTEELLIVSAADIKTTDDIQKLAKNISGRLRHN
jgi:hypothetical protein